MSRITATIYPETNLTELHNALCHPGITRMYHWVRAKNLPYTLDDIKRMTNACSCCNEIKPRFCRNKGQLIKATSPFERLNLDFKGPLPTSTKNRFLLTIVDEFSRFPFAFPCSDISASTVIKVLSNVFSLFGTPAYIHSDRGTSFMSRELKSFLTSLGVATSRTTAYNPQGNGQVERYNGIIWRTILLALKLKGIRTEQWEEVLQPALHSIRSLLCTATNATPHERMFNHPRRSFTGCSLPTWLLQPGPVLMKNHSRQNKYEPIVQEVELLEANPNYAHVKLPDGRESSVSIRHLAPRGDSIAKIDTESLHLPLPTTRAPAYAEYGAPPSKRALDHLENETATPDDENDIPVPESDHSMFSPVTGESSIPNTSLSRRQRRPPAYLDDYVTY